MVEDSEVVRMMEMVMLKRRMEMMEENSELTSGEVVCLRSEGARITSWQQESWG